MNCKDCKHFDPPTAAHEKDWGQCIRGRGNDGDPKDESTLAYGCDYECYSSFLYVKAEFGCVQFKAKS